MAFAQGETFGPFLMGLVIFSGTLGFDWALPLLLRGEKLKSYPFFIIILTRLHKIWIELNSAGKVGNKTWVRSKDDCI